MASVYCWSHLMNQVHQYIVELIDRINETMYHYSIVSKMDEVILNQYREVEEDRLYRRPLKQTCEC